MRHETCDGVLEVALPTDGYPSDSAVAGALRIWCQKEHLKKGVTVEFVESIRNISDERAIRVTRILLSGSSLKAKTNRLNTLSEAVFDPYSILTDINHLR